MEGRIVIEMLWALVFILGCSLLLRAYEVWVRPKRLRSKLQRQGISGPPPTLLYGNAPEMMKIQSAMTKAATTDGQHVFHDWHLSMFPYLQQWTQEYGQIYTYTTGNKQHVYVSQPELMKELNLNKSLDLGRPSYLSKSFEPLLGSDGILRANGQNWAHQRKIIAPEFFMDKIKGMMGLMEESATTMVRKWERQIIECKGGVIEMIIDEDLRTLSADVISKACFGSSYSQGKLIFAKIGVIQEAVSKPSLLFGLQNFSYLPTKFNREMWRLKKEVNTLILNVVKERQEESRMGGKSDKDLLQKILENASAMSDKTQDVNKLNRFIVDNCKNIYFAGHETTAIAASWCLMLLAFYPEWQESVRAEIIKVCGDGDHYRSPDTDALPKLKTLNMVIQETLRLYGPGVLNVKEVFSDVKLGEFVLPKGINVWNFVPAMHRDTENWGPDANEFKPERFARGLSEACNYPLAYIPFGYGARLCVGQSFTMLELKIVLSLILSKFCVSLSPKYRHSPVYRLLLVPEYGVRLVVRKV